MCNSAIKVQTENYTSSKVDTKGNPIVIPMKVNYCTNSTCSHSWIAHHEEVRVDKAIKSASRYRLGQKEIQSIRNALNFSTRSEAANFLSLNEKAFTKWEKGYFPMNDAYDLLLRLSVHSRSNFEFIKQLQEKQFKFETEDYELLCEKSGLAWRYAKAEITTKLDISHRRANKENTKKPYFMSDQTISTSQEHVFDFNNTPILKAV
jgi:DNA-binding transcriptional regulator YiaG